MRKLPKPVPIERLCAPESHRWAWTATPKASALTGNVKPEEKERARVELARAISQDGWTPEDCEFVWTLIETSWGWVAKLKEAA